MAASVLKVGMNRIWFDEKRLEEIKDVITKAKVRLLVKDKAIQVRPMKGVSRIRVRKRLQQKRKGRRKGQGSMKGKRTSRLPDKKEWISKVRLQRKFLKMLREKKLITPQGFKMLSRKVKGGFFRSKRHIKIFVNEHNFIKDEKGNRKL